MDMITSKSSLDKQQTPVEKRIRDASRYIIEQILSKRGKVNVEHLKRKVSKEYDIPFLLKNADILQYATPEEKEIIKDFLKTKTIRSISGVVVVSVMIPPLPCPGKCIYCPTSSIAPKSYTGNEPAALRARMFDYDSYKQVEARLRQLEMQGHDVSKVEIIVMGGTFPAYSKIFQENFIKGIYDALNGFRAGTLEEAMKINETAKRRCVALTIETRPDYAKERHIDMMLSYMATRVELGVQVLSDRLLKKIRRGHTLKDVIESTRRLKDAAYKVGYHIMPGFQDEEKDLKMFKKLFTNPDFRPDMLKIYPVLVIKGTELYEMWKKGEYEALDDESAAELIAKLYKYIPEYVRVMRVQRDIPAYAIEAGVKKSNLRDMVMSKMREMGIKCREIRCREAGHVYLREGKIPRNVEVIVRKYKASKGEEYFISAEDVEQDILVGYLRMRFPYKPYRKEISKDDALIRELKVVGLQVPIGKRKEQGFQHRGIGRMLLHKAEEIAKDKGKEKIHIISAVGTREYYRKFGYKLQGPYMSKRIE